MAKRTWQEIVEITEMRRSANATLLNEMLAVRARYNGDVVIPLGGATDTEPQLPPITPALVAESIDNVSLRAASVMPAIDVPALDPTKQEGVKSRQFAKVRRSALHGTWFASDLPILLRRGFRHLAGYASTTLVVVADHERRTARIELRDPLGSYPELKAAEDMSPPRDCGLVYERSAGWTRANFPASRSENGGPITGDGSDELWDLVEWIDEHVTMIGILGPRDPEGASAKEVARGRVAPSLPLGEWENKAGRPTVVTAQRVTLDRIASQIAHSVGMTDLMAKIMALALIAEEKAVFPDRWVVARQGESARVISNGGQWADGRTGQTNVLDGVMSVGQLNAAPPNSTYQMIDRIERNWRVSTGLVPQFGGETYGSLRTGRGIDSMMGVAVDPRVQELQEIMASALRHVNEIVTETWKGYWPNRKVELFSGWGGKARLVEFTPSKHLETPANMVTYAIPGADVQGVTIQLGQLLGADAIGLRSFRDKHPWIGDADDEGALVDEEKLERAAFEAILQQVAAGSMPLVMLAKIEKFRRTNPNGDIFTAIQLADEELRAEQAALPPEPAPDQVAPPEMMPGLAASPDAMNGPPMLPPETAPQIGPTDGQTGLASLVSALQAG